MKLCCIKCGSYEINHSASDGCDSQLKYLCGVCHWKTLAEIRLAYVGQLERNVNELKEMNNQLCEINLKVSQGITMSQPINDGGPAFPHTTQWDGITPAINHHGISMRDYFAAAALQGLLASPAEAEFGVSHFATAAYEAADAMIRAREAK